MKNFYKKQWKNSTVNSGEIPRLTDNENIVNYGEIPQKQWKNSTVNSGEIPHNKNIYKNNNKNIYAHSENEQVYIMKMIYKKKMIAYLLIP